MIYGEIKTKEWLQKYLINNSLDFNSIERVNKFPSNFFHIDWSLGISGEIYYYYKVTFIGKNAMPIVIYFIISTLLNILIVKVRCFDEQNGKFRMTSVKTIKNRYSI